MAALFAAVATALRVALIPWIAFVDAYDVALIAVVAATVLLGLGPGLLVVVLANAGVETFVLRSVPAAADGATLVRFATSVATGVLMASILHAVRATAVRARGSEARLAGFAGATFEGIVESEGGLITDCNEQFAKLVGRTVAELRGAAIADLAAPEDRDRVAANIGNRESVVEHAMLRADGSRTLRGGPRAAGRAGQLSPLHRRPRRHRTAGRPMRRCASRRRSLPRVRQNGSAIGAHAPRGRHVPRRQRHRETLSGYSRDEVIGSPREDAHLAEPGVRGPFRRGAEGEGRPAWLGAGVPAEVR